MGLTTAQLEVLAAAGAFDCFGLSRREAMWNAGNAAHNATNAQQQSYVTAQSATTMGVATLYSLDIASTGTATAEVYRRGLL